MNMNMNNKVDLLEKDFNRLSKFIHAELGIKMPAVKKVLIESRLQKRLRWLDIETFGEYCDYLLSPRGREVELTNFINKITTNKTDFFREPAHFNYLNDQILPDLIKSWRGERGQLTVWSAGCSSGEEPYTLAMVLDHYKEQNTRLAFDYSILGTDISMEALRTAISGVYSESRIQPLTLEMKKKYLLRSKAKERQLVKIVHNLRKKVNFKILNFMDKKYSIGKMDIIFCRNVIIYFNKKVQEQTLLKLCDNLKPGGYFFQGHSESIHGFKLPLKNVYPTIYQKI